MNDAMNTRGQDQYSYKDFPSTDFEVSVIISVLFKIRVISGYWQVYL